MGTETDTESSNKSEIQPLAEFDPNKEPVSKLDERDVIEPLKESTDDGEDQEPDNESDTAEDASADEQEIPLDGADEQAEIKAEAAASDASDESEIHLDETEEVDDPDSGDKVVSFAAASESPDSDGGAGPEDETNDSNYDGDGDSPDNEEQSAGEPPKKPIENDNDGAVAEDDAEDSEPDVDGDISDEEEQPSVAPPKEPTEDNNEKADGADDAKVSDPAGEGNSSDEEEPPEGDPPKEPVGNNEKDFVALDDDEIDDGIDAKAKKEDKAADGDKNQAASSGDPGKNKTEPNKDQGQIKKIAPKKEPLPKSTAKGKKGKKPVKDTASLKKIIVSIIIILMVAGAVIYSRPALFGLKDKPVIALPAKAETKQPAKQTEIQTRKPAPAGKNDRYLSKIEDVTRLRDKLLAKKEEIYRLKLHYRNGIVELKDRLSREMQDANISTFAQALENKRIELGLRTIQRREVYIQELEKPDQWIHHGSEELLFLKRKALLDFQMMDIASGIDLNRHMRYMNAALQKYQPSADKLAVDPPPAEPTPLETIWGQIHNQQAENVQIPLGQDNKKIIAEICSGNYGRIAELTAITPEAAKCLARMNGSELFLNGLTQLTPTEAKYLFKWEGNWICLNSIKNLSPAVAKHLFKWDGNWISLNGLTELPPELALYLTEWKGNQLELMGLNSENSKPNKRTLKYLALWETMGGKLFVSEDIRNEMARVM
jgi:hypothetical protein